MKQLTIVVKPFRAEAVLRAIAELGVDSCVVREAKGYSRQKGYLDRYLGSEYSMAFLPKVEITICVGDDRLDTVVQTIARTARTGRMGDGKIFVAHLVLCLKDGRIECQGAPQAILTGDTLARTFGAEAGVYVHHQH